MIEFIHLFFTDAKVFVPTVLIGVPVGLFGWCMWRLGKDLGLF